MVYRITFGVYCFIGISDLILVFYRIYRFIGRRPECSTRPLSALRRSFPRGRPAKSKSIFAWNFYWIQVLQWRCLTGPAFQSNSTSVIFTVGIILLTLTGRFATTFLKGGIHRIGFVRSSSPGLLWWRGWSVLGQVSRKWDTKAKFFLHNILCDRKWTGLK